MLDQFIKCANWLDTNGYRESADVVDQIAKRVALLGLGMPAEDGRDLGVRNYKGDGYRPDMLEPDLKYVASMGLDVMRMTEDQVKQAEKYLRNGLPLPPHLQQFQYDNSNDDDADTDDSDTYPSTAGFVPMSGAASSASSY